MALRLIAVGDMQKAMLVQPLTGIRVGRELLELIRVRRSAPVWHAARLLAPIAAAVAPGDRPPAVQDRDPPAGNDEPDEEAQEREPGYDAEASARSSSDAAALALWFDVSGQGP